MAEVSGHSAGIQTRATVGYILSSLTGLVVVIGAILSSA
jgi:hypothetical protein